ncbi:MAG: hypothetical protein RBS39_11915 [Phycisphaerales bacterium]|jgi:hypothetical protein|nr:hypothetical protein [Phycisphaerales bacterium]
MRTIVILAGLGLAASMATADITYYDASANPVPIVPFNGDFDWPGGETPTVFDITKAPSEQGPDSSRSIFSSYGVGGGHYEWSGMSLGGRSDVEVLSGIDLLLTPDIDPGTFYGLYVRQALAAGTAIQDYENVYPEIDTSTTILSFETPMVFGGLGGSPIPRVTGLFGAQLSLPSGTHYGWFELTWVRDSLNIFQFPAVSRWAWNDTPGGGILAGQVPAPGAMMVLGVGGLVATRRRR